MGKTPVYVADHRIVSKCDALYLGRTTYHDKDLRDEGKALYVADEPISSKRVAVYLGRTTYRTYRDKDLHDGGKPCTSRKNILPASVMQYIWPTKLTVTET